MTEYSALYYPSWDPPVAWLRAMLLFYDKINVILPKDVKPNYEPANANVIDLIPDAIGAIRESQYEIDHNKYNFQTIAKAFDYIAEVNPCARSECVKIVIPEKGVSYDGYSLLHKSKFNDEIFKLLKERNLCHPGLNIIAEKPDFLVVNRQASSLILSLIADNYASQEGIRTLTDRSLFYTVNALSSNYFHGKGSALGHLASAIIRLEVPANLSDLTAKEYVEYRKLFGNVREPFHKALNELYDDNLLSDVTKPDKLEKRVKSIAKEFCDEIEEIRKHKTYSKFKEYTFVTLKILAGLCRKIPEPFTKALGTGTQLSVSAYQTLKPIGYTANIKHTQRLLANFDKDLIPESLIKKLR